MEKEPFDTLLVLVQENRQYLSGFTGHDGQFDESAGALLISTEKQVLATDSRYVAQARQESPDFEIFCYKNGLAHSIPDILAELKTQVLGFEAVRLSHLHFSRIKEQLEKHNAGIRLYPCEGFVEQLRAVKNKIEIEAIKQSLALSESIFESILGLLAPGMIENELAWAIEKGIREAGAESVAFPPIVASGPNAALPHAVPTGRAVKKGEPLLFDWGARLQGYCSDISRTVIMGKPDSTFKTVYQVVKDAQALAVDAIKPGTSTQDIDKVARDHIASKGFGEFFVHGLGHGVGLATHEQPHLSPFRPTILEEGMVMTVEPGIYVNDWGGVRLENMVVVRSQGAEVINRLPVTPAVNGVLR